MWTVDASWMDAARGVVPFFLSWYPGGALPPRFTHGFSIIFIFRPTQDQECIIFIILRNPHRDLIQDSHQASYTDRRLTTQKARVQTHEKAHVESSHVSSRRLMSLSSTVDYTASLLRLPLAAPHAAAPPTSAAALLLPLLLLLLLLLRLLRLLFHLHLHHLLFRRPTWRGIPDARRRPSRRPSRRPPSRPAPCGRRCRLRPAARGPARSCERRRRRPSAGGASPC